VHYDDRASALCFLKELMAIAREKVPCKAVAPISPVVSVQKSGSLEPGAGGCGGDHFLSSQRASPAKAKQAAICAFNPN
jgi:hypothetical protein